MRPRQPAILSVLSLLLFVAVCLVWVRSYASETILVESRQGQFLLIGFDGPPEGIHTNRERQTTEKFLATLRTPLATPGRSNSNRLREHRLLGFWWVRGDENHALRAPFWIVGVPYWFLALLTVIAPLWWLWRHRKLALRRQVNACTNCGYDLRATPARCPECGAVPDARTQ